MKRFRHWFLIVFVCALAAVFAIALMGCDSLSRDLRPFLAYHVITRDPAPALWTPEPAESEADDEPSAEESQQMALCLPYTGRHH